MQRYLYRCKGLIFFIFVCSSKFFIFVSLMHEINSYREKYINKAIDLWVKVRYYKCKLVITNETKNKEAP